MFGNTKQLGEGGTDERTVLSVVSSSLQIDDERIQQLRDLLKSGDLKHKKIHLVFLVHGIMGNPQELGYLLSAIEKKVVGSFASGGGGTTAERETTQEEAASKKQPILLAHSVAANSGKTFDGIAAGGKRVAEEINDLIDKISRISTSQEDERGVTEQPEPLTITVSFVGHSLGGLYSRYALKHIDALQEKEETNPSAAVKVLPKIFCTTATPHLGTGNHTYLHLPRPLEWVTSQVLLQTGRDLFRTSAVDVIEQMATDPDFTKPLRSFEKRLAYATAFGTDFQVPLATAAFLADIDSIHYPVRSTADIFDQEKAASVDSTILGELSTAVTSQVESKAKQAEGPETQSEQQFSTFVVETPYSPSTSALHSEMSGGSRKASHIGDQKSDKMDSAEIARCLDALGWTKVFCDLRPLLWKISNPFSNFFSSSRSTSDDSILEANGVPPVSSLEIFMSASSPLSSSELLKMIERSPCGSWHAPFGHTILVANSKNAKYAKWNSAGRPIMDKLADELVDWIVEET